ncbi:hypothetical protein [Marivirga arenosa]|uniref:Uncharacterized protein n=1 Tax=Marivirga arenosa TaxID=3059076 RepID=A0AA51X536_9BACT|nr:hypothetical protein [Marivirga sp. BKB1-2]WNB16954.1 hypothetical protein QYS47_32395 [Marivirga sp. BKB1-2]
MRRYLVILFLINIISFNAESQRIRYKNLFPLLQSKDYKTAEPQLLAFLSENDDEANAYFYLGEIIVSKLDTIPIFPTHNQFDSMANKAIEAYKKSIELVDDREVRKNDNYYAAYNRRDLRTGKFGIKISDIHLDYENKIEAIREKLGLLEDIYQLKISTLSSYENFSEKILKFQNKFPDELAFLLRAKQEDIDKLTDIVTSYNNLIVEYTSFSEKLNAMNHPKHQADLNISKIENWNDLNKLKFDQENFNLEIYDYEAYLSKLQERIEKEVIPFKAMLLKTVNDFNSDLSNNTEAQDSTDLRDLKIPENLSLGLKELDKTNTIFNILAYKIQKNETNLFNNANLYPVLADSTNIYQRANLVEFYQVELSKQLALIEQIEDLISERIFNDFNSFFEGFEPSFEAYLETEKTIVKQKLELATKRSDEMAKQIQFFSYESDSIFSSYRVAATFESNKYVLNTIELDSTLILNGSIADNPFIASAAFDMNIGSLVLLHDSTFTLNKMILLNDNILINLESSKDDQRVQVLHYYTTDLEELWSIEYESELVLADAKVEAGIFFIYSEKGEVIQTLNSQGEIIGN